MVTKTSWSGFVSDILDELQTILDAAKANLGNNGVDEVLTGERRGWKGTMMFIQQDPRGAPKGTDSGHTGLSVYEPTILLLVAKKGSTGSDDIEVMRILEDANDTIDDNPALGETYTHDFLNPVQVFPSKNEGGEYDTLGASTVRFRKKINRR